MSSNPRQSSTCPFCGFSSSKDPYELLFVCPCPSYEADDPVHGWPPITQANSTFSTSRPFILRASLPLWLLLTRFCVLGKAVVSSCRRTRWPTTKIFTSFKTERCRPQHLSHNLSHPQNNVDHRALLHLVRRLINRRVDRLVLFKLGRLFSKATSHDPVQRTNEFDTNQRNMSMSVRIPLPLQAMAKTKVPLGPAKQVAVSLD